MRKNEIKVGQILDLRSDTFMHSEDDMWRKKAIKVEVLETDVARTLKAGWSDGGNKWHEERERKDCTRVRVLDMPFHELGEMHFKPADAGRLSVKVVKGMELVVTNRQLFRLWETTQTLYEDKIASEADAKNAAKSLRRGFEDARIKGDVYDDTPGKVNIWLDSDQAARLAELLTDPDWADQA